MLCVEEEEGGGMLTSLMDDDNEFTKQYSTLQYRHISCNC